MTGYGWSTSQPRHCSAVPRGGDVPMYHGDDHVFMMMGLISLISLISIRSGNRFAVLPQSPKNHGLGTRHRDTLARLEKSIRAFVFLPLPTEPRQKLST